ncbi:hypothetical protein LTV02_31765 [Nocardia yamanashiensis]|uniref:hypothetical protein n=1 Tax=Nocardia yamanashiensis TaxID=209247 RepID=UPI001E43CDCD|nr:hypothetical protein [Nocardia yamanashiensis]UGT40537.1 hypothetical protein LTV02_31765 [Nocardia yamanashiensis]
MSDDAAQDKTTEEAAKADAVQPGGQADSSGDAATEKIPAAPESSEAKPDLSKKSEPETAAATPPVPPAAPKPKAGIPSGGGGNGSALPMIAAFAAGVVVVAAIAGGAVLWKKSSDRADELDARDTATAAACDFGKAISNYDSKHLDDYFSNVKALSTGQWEKDFGTATDSLKELMVSVQVKTNLDEIHCAWESGDENKAKVVLILSQTRTNSVNPQPDQLTVPGIASMEKVDGKWKVSAFDSPATRGLFTGGSGSQGTTVTPSAPATPAPKPGN